MRILWVFLKTVQVVEESIQNAVLCQSCWVLVLK